MKVKKVEKEFNKLIRKEIGPDGFAQVDKVVIDKRYNTIELYVSFGEATADGNESDWVEKVMLEYPDGKNVHFLQGMFYESIRKFF